MRSSRKCLTPCRCREFTMKNDFKSDNKLAQSLLETLIKAGWIEKSGLVDSSVGKRGRISIKFTKRGAKHMARLKDFNEVPGKDAAERQQIYGLLEYWNSISPPPIEFGGQ